MNYTTTSPSPNTSPKQERLTISKASKATYDCDIISYYFDGVTPNPYPNSRHFDTALRNAEVSSVKNKRGHGIGAKLHINTEFGKYNSSLPKAP